MILKNHSSILVILSICLEEFDNVDDEGYVPDYLNQDRIEGRFQQRYELSLTRREMAGIYHTSHGHCNNRQTVMNLQAQCIECNNLMHYILAHRCDACDAAPGRRHHKVKATVKVKRKKVKATMKATRKLKSTSKTAAPPLLPSAVPVELATAPAVKSSNSLTEHLDLEFSTIKDAIDPTVTITEFLARLFQHKSNKPSNYPNIAQMRNMSDTTKDPAIGEDATTTSVNTTTPLFSPPGTDLRMDWEDACSLGCLPDLNRYLLLIIDKGTEYFVSFSTKTRASPLALLKQFVTFTGKTIRYLRIDGAKEFQSKEIKEYCAENDVVLQLVVAYNHTMQARVEGAIGCIKQHSRTSLLHAGKPTRFWDDTTKDFGIKKNYLWASPDTCGKLETPHDRMQPAFFGTHATVAVPFRCQVIAQLPREHHLVKNGSFGHRFIEGTYLYID